jgi:hypothetical protein
VKLRQTARIGKTAHSFVLVVEITKEEKLLFSEKTSALF